MPRKGRRSVCGQRSFGRSLLQSLGVGKHTSKIWLFIWQRWWNSGGTRDGQGLAWKGCVEEALGHWWSWWAKRNRQKPDSKGVTKANLNLASQGFKLPFRTNGFSVQECIHRCHYSFTLSHGQALKDTWTLIMTWSNEKPSRTLASEFFVCAIEPLALPALKVKIPQFCSSDTLDTCHVPRSHGDCTESMSILTGRAV